MNTKVVNVRVTIQLDVPAGLSQESENKFVVDALDLINLDLQRSGLMSSPQILTSDLDASSIQVVDEY